MSMPGFYARILSLVNTFSVEALRELKQWLIKITAQTEILLQSVFACVEDHSILKKKVEHYITKHNFQFSSNLGKLDKAAEMLE